MSFTVLSVAYPLAPVSPDATGGAEQVLAALDRAFLRRGLRSLVVAREDSRVAGMLIPLPNRPGPLDETAREAARAAAREAIAAALRNYQVDLVHLHGIDFHAYLPAGVPVLSTLHLPPAWYPPQVFADFRTYLNCVSSSQQRACPPCPRLLDPIPNGIDPALFLSSADKQDYALALGRICPEKGFHLALDAAQQAGIRLVLAGELYPYPEHLQYFEEQIRPRLDGQTRLWIGAASLARKRELLARARCVLIPSPVAETSSLVAMEATASGTPVIAYPKGALTDLVEHGETGFLVHDVAGMARAIAAASTLSPATCRLWAEERFSVSRTVEGYLDAYEKVSSRNPAPALKLELIYSIERLRAIRPEWLDLFEATPGASPFLHPVWQLCWWDQFGSCPLHTLALWRGSRLEALAPLFRFEGRLVFIGQGISDRLDLLARSHTAARRLVSALEDAPYGLNLEEVPAGSPLLDLPHERSSVSPRLELSVPLPSKLRKNLRRAARRLEGRLAAAPGSIEDLFHLHDLRWSASSGGGVLAAEPVRRFHRAVAAGFQACGLRRLWTLRIDRRPAAAFYGFAHAGRLFYYLGAFDPAWKRFSVGSLAIAHAIEQARAEGLRQFDFLRGEEPYKFRWGAARRTLYRVFR